jgi:hypothetical protein
MNDFAAVHEGKFGEFATQLGTAYKKGAMHT